MAKIWTSRLLGTRVISFERNNASLYLREGQAGFVFVSYAFLYHPFSVKKRETKTMEASLSRPPVNKGIPLKIAVIKRQDGTALTNRYALDDS